jgi:multisubunit Na+/H+ antiporter MnhB subunit
MDSGGFILKTEAQARKAANIVCAVVLDYRGYDTLGEATILLAAIAGAAALLKVKAR